MPDSIAELVSAGIEVAKVAPAIQRKANQVISEPMPETAAEYLDLDQDLRSALLPGERFVSAAERARLRQQAQQNVGNIGQ